LHYIGDLIQSSSALDLMSDQRLAKTPAKARADSTSAMTPVGRLAPAGFKRGPGGRPTRREAERRHGALLATAVRLFLDHGFDGVSIDQIAREATVAKRFIYARYRDKSALFIAAFEHWAKDRLDVLRTFAPSAERADVGLVKFGQTMIDMALEPDALALQRLLIAAAPRFPGLAANVVAQNRHRSIGEIERVLSFYASRGEIELADARATAEQFFIAIIGIPQRLALLGLREPPVQERQRLRLAVRLFLDGCRVGRGRSKA
jgi:TetR/AcrR family transcriptional regulator, mexJK operon transcriptional repressor